MDVHLQLKLNPLVARDLEYEKLLELSHALSKVIPLMAATYSQHTINELVIEKQRINRRLAELSQSKQNRIQQAKSVDWQD